MSDQSAVNHTMIVRPSSGIQRITAYPLISPLLSVAAQAFRALLRPRLQSCGTPSATDATPPTSPLLLPKSAALPHWLLLWQDSKLMVGVVTGISQDDDPDSSEP